ncbi:tRNA preQ1(34) S-adenosylmethionine ribosyltransferase-isomerase QueA [bacterium]|nr:tRNA preQ1(34) S-adenosylmethionine ribosyltransferase-isomerase QueA [bacterium]
MPDFTSLDSYDYELPGELIAQHPPTQRDGARLMIVNRVRQQIELGSMRDLPGWLSPGDCLVLNNSRVVPARLVGQRTQTGGAWEGLFLGLHNTGQWRIIGQTRGRLQPGELLTIVSPHLPEDRLLLQLEERGEGGQWLVTPASDESCWKLLDRYGSVPLPPYIRHGQEDLQDRERYQTVYASQPGSVAAPTAGLHFTPELLAACAQRGLSQAEVTLHVGLGTFRPVNVANIREHEMHAEWCSVPQSTVTTWQETRHRGHRVVAVGTTSLRTLETAAEALHLGQNWEGESKIFIYPPYQFRAVDALLTNFHLPKSTLLMLVCALGGYDLIRRAYDLAIAEKFRFFSYGDAMLIL